MSEEELRPPSSDNIRTLQDVLLRHVSVVLTFKKEILNYMYNLSIVCIKCFFNVFMIYLDIFSWCRIIISKK